AWVPRRAGDRGAVDAGALPGLLPGGSSVYDAAVRAELERLWGCEAGTIPQSAGRDTAGILRAAADGELGGLLVGGVDLDDLADPAAAREALRRVGFVVSLELRHSSVTEYADVVLPVAVAAEKGGTYYDWEGRQRPFVAALLEAGTLRDAQVLDALAQELGVSLGAVDLVTLRESFATAAGFAGLARAESVFPRVAGYIRTPDPGEAILATWHHLLDSGALQVGEQHLAGTAPRPVARLSSQTADELGLSTAQSLVVSNSNGAITLPWVATDMPPRVVWLPTNSPGSAVRRDLAADSGDVVRLAPESSSSDNFVEVAEEAEGVNRR
ncbi:MAG: molybdopterin-dependent oxidoreductase, partial [Mycobacteriales bacterium]